MDCRDPYLGGMSSDRMDRGEGAQTKIRKFHYLICNDPNRIIQELSGSSFQIGECLIQTSPGVSICVSRNAEVSVVLIGEAIDPFNPSYSNQVVSDELLSAAPDALRFSDKLASYSGSYIVFVISKDGEVQVHLDTFGTRQAYYYLRSKQWAVSSDPHLVLQAFQVGKEIDEETQQILKHPKFEKSGRKWYGTTWFDRRVKRLLPNHVIAFPSGKLCRVTLNKPGNADSYRSVCESALNILRGTIDGIHTRFSPVYQAITGGFDSRVLLAATDPKWFQNTKWHIFERGNKFSMDSRLALKLADQLDIDFEVIHPQRLSKEFWDRIGEELNIRDRIMSRNLWWYHKEGRAGSSAIINGNGSEVLRLKFSQGKRRNLSPSMLRNLTGFPEYFGQEIDVWREELNRDESSQWIPNADLFYWEQQMAYWGALIPLEHYFAMDLFSPFNNRQLLLALLSSPETMRSPPAYQIYRDLIELANPALLSVPFLNKALGFSSPLLNQMLSKVPYFYSAKSSIRLATSAFKSKLRKL